MSLTNNININFFITLCKIFITLFLLFYIFKSADFNRLFEHISNSDISILLLGFSVGFFKTISGLARLFCLLKNKFAFVSFKLIALDSLAAGFYNVFLPTALGGDVPKVFMLSKHLSDKKKIVATVLVDRFLGFLALIFLALFSILFLSIVENNDELNVLKIVVPLVTIVSLATIFVFAKIKIRFNFLQKFNFSFLSKVENLLNTLVIDVKLFNRRVIVNALIISFTYQVLSIVSVYILGCAINIKVPLIYYFLFLPVIFVLIMAPISISGFGLREGAFIYFFAMAGVTTEKALLLSFLFYFHNIIIGIIGGSINLIRLISERKT